MIRHFLILIALALAVALACGCARGHPSRSPHLSAEQHEPATRRAAKPTVIAEYHGERRPIIRIYNDGRVEFSRDLIRGESPLQTGQLSAVELQRLIEVLARFSEGIGEGIVIIPPQGAHAIRFRMTLALPGREPLILDTAFRYRELAGSGELQYPLAYNAATQSTRFEGRQKIPPKLAAMRAVWVELEAELLRSVAQSIIDKE